MGRFAPPDQKIDHYHQNDDRDYYCHDYDDDDADDDGEKNQGR